MQYNSRQKNNQLDTKLANGVRICTIDSQVLRKVIRKCIGLISYRIKSLNSCISTRLKFEGENQLHVQFSKEKISKRDSIPQYHHSNQQNLWILYQKKLSNVFLTGLQVRSQIYDHLNNKLLASSRSRAILRISSRGAPFWKGECLGYNAKFNLFEESRVDIKCRSIEVQWSIGYV